MPGDKPLIERGQGRSEDGGINTALDTHVPVRLRDVSAVMRREMPLDGLRQIDHEVILEGPDEIGEELAELRSAVAPEGIGDHDEAHDVRPERVEVPPEMGPVGTREYRIAAHGVVGIASGLARPAGHRPHEDPAVRLGQPARCAELDQGGGVGRVRVATHSAVFLHDAGLCCLKLRPIVWFTKPMRTPTPHIRFQRFQSPGSL